MSPTLSVSLVPSLPLHLPLFPSVQKLEELKEYMDHKEETMNRIKDLEETLSNERSRFESAIADFENQVLTEKQKYVILRNIENIEKFLQIKNNV